MKGNILFNILSEMKKQSMPAEKCLDSMIKIVFVADKYKFVELGGTEELNIGLIVPEWVRIKRELKETDYKALLLDSKSTILDSKSISYTQIDEIFKNISNFMQIKKNKLDLIK